MIGGNGEIRTHGAFRHDSFQDCCNKPDSATFPNLVETTGIEPVVPKAADLQSTASPLMLRLHDWCPGRDSNSQLTASKTAVFTNFTTGAIHIKTH